MYTSYHVHAVVRAGGRGCPGRDLLHAAGAPVRVHAAQLRVRHAIL